MESGDNCEGCQAVHSHPQYFACEPTIADSFSKCLFHRQILTFDQHGISNHPNHISLPAGIRHLMRDPQDQHLRLFTLKTVPMLPKYIGPFSHIVAKLWSSIVQTPKHPTFVAGFKDYQTALQAMYQHWSQLVWFRWLYVLFSRYMWVNEWVPVHVA